MTEHSAAGDEPRVVSTGHRRRGAVAGPVVVGSRVMIGWFRRIDALVADAPVSLLCLSFMAVGAGLVVVLVLLADLL